MLRDLEHGLNGLGVLDRSVPRTASKLRCVAKTPSGDVLVKHPLLCLLRIRNIDVEGADQEIDRAGGRLDEQA